MWNRWKTYGSANCNICGDLFVKKIAPQKLCGKLECRKIYAKRAHLKSVLKLKDRKKVKEEPRTGLNRLLSLYPAHMSMDDHWLKGYYLKRKKQGMEPEEAYQQAIRDLKLQKRKMHFYSNTIPIGAVSPEEGIENAAKAS